MSKSNHALAHISCNFRIHFNRQHAGQSIINNATELPFNLLYFHIRKGGILFESPFIKRKREILTKEIYPFFRNISEIL